jgi:predicted nucleic acid-binding Zn ribbon protein
MPILSETKKCVSCGRPIKGRADKKFCDDACRNTYNNELKSKSRYSNYVRNINNALLKNRKILEELLPEGEETAKASHDKLNQKGFVFKYHTHTYANKKGNTYFFTYDYGFLPLENNWYLIVRRKEE